MKFLSEKTAVPLGIAIIAIGGGAIWLTTMHIQGQANAAAIAIIDAKQDRYAAEIQKMNESLAVIRTKVENIDLKMRR